MAISVRCRCKNTFEVPASFAGKSSMCPQCGTFVDISEDGEQLNAPVEPEEEAEDELSPRELKRMIRRACDGAIRPVRRTPGYRLAVLCVGATLLLLAAFYVGLVVAMPVLIFWHLTTNYTLFGAVHIWWALILYLGPVFVGLILMVFLVKPLLARPGRRLLGRLVNLDQEPVLATFVDEIAAAVRAPRPRRVAVNCEVNASASLGSGLFAVFGQNLTLTLGLPLVRGLDANQLAGIVAHELGHFSQGAGMRVSYLVAVINNWFHRVVYERDAWDDALDDWCRQGAGVDGAYRVNAYSAWIAQLAQVCVMLTRIFLWVLMMVAHVISGFLLRRMEFDADRAEARLVGVPVFNATSRRMAVLTAAAAEANEIVEGCWLKDRYPDDFAALVVGLADGMSPRERRRVLEELEDAGTGLFDSHPSYTDRLASVERDDPEGVFDLDLPATALVCRLRKLSEAASLTHYRSLFGGGLQPTLRPTRDYLKGRT